MNDDDVSLSAPNVAVMFYNRVEASGDREAFRYLEGDRWVSMTWQEAAERVDALAAGLLALGIEPEQRVSIATSTRLEWVLADLAIMCAGAATTTVYPTTNAPDTAYIVGDSERASSSQRTRHRSKSLPPTAMSRPRRTTLPMRSTSKSNVCLRRTKTA